MAFSHTILQNLPSGSMDTVRINREIILHYLCWRRLAMLLIGVFAVRRTRRLRTDDKRVVRFLLSRTVLAAYGSESVSGQIRL
jgi:hypothetical protein